MAKTTIKQVSLMMRGLDLCMFTTVSGRGITSSRPMSNNSDVNYDGTSYYFTNGDTRMIHQIKKNPHVNLSYINDGLLSKIFVSVSGKARLTKKFDEMSAHWTPDLELWFKKGLKTPGLVMIEVKAHHIKFWKNNKEGEITLH